jgi:ribonucleoside-diphosphate reductase alpha chain
MEDFKQRAKSASLLATLQAGFTDFHYLRYIWEVTTKEDALIGVGLTGIGSNAIDETYDLVAISDIVKQTNQEVALKIGIEPAARTTTVKPSGTTSCVVGQSSGIHAWYDDYYIRRIQLNSNDPLVPYLLNNHPELIKPYQAIPGSYVLEIPQKAPENAILRHESALTFLERVLKYNLEWVRPGHVEGANMNNVSATCYVKADEWDAVGKWIWDNRNSVNGISVLPYDGGTYIQAPFETISKETYESMMTQLHAIDLTQVFESDDNTMLNDQAACSGGACSIV